MCWSRILSQMFGCHDISDHASWIGVFHYCDTKLSCLEKIKWNKTMTTSEGMLLAKWLPVYQSLSAYSVWCNDFWFLIFFNKKQLLKMLESWQCIQFSERWCHHWQNTEVSRWSWWSGYKPNASHLFFIQAYPYHMAIMLADNFLSLSLSRLSFTPLRNCLLLELYAYLQRSLFLQ